MRKFLSYYLEIFLIIISSIVIFYKNKDFGFSTNLIIILMIACIILILLNFVKKLKKINYIPIFVLSNFYIFVCYLSLYYFDKNVIFNDIEKKSYIFALEILFISYVVFLLGYLIAKKIFYNFKRKEFVYLNSNLNEIYFIGLFYQISNIFFFYIIEIQRHLPAIAQIKYPTLVFGCGLLTLYICLNKGSKNIIKNKIIPLLLIIMPIIFDIANGSYSYPFMLAFILFIFYSYIQKKIIIAPIIILFFIFLIVHVGKYEFRDNIKKSEQFGYHSNLSKIPLFFTTYKKIFSDIPTYNKVVKCRYVGEDDDSDCKFIRDYRLEKRIFHSMQSLTIVTSKTPKDIPYWNGYSYKILASKIIPRIFWKEKPSDRMGNEFGHRYNVLTPENKLEGNPADTTTSWNMPVINEFFVNFGLKGSIFGMLFLGLLFGILEKVFFIKNDYNLEKVISFFVLVPLFFIESHVSLLFGGVIQSYVFLIITSYLLLIIKRKFIN